MSRKTLRNMVLMIWFDIFLVLITVLFAILYHHFGRRCFLSLYVTFLTISYHFVMRLLVGQTVTLLYRNRKFHLNSGGFRLYPFEPGLYKKIKVKKWKANMITAKPEQFDLRKNSLESLLHNMAQAELVHRIIMLLSFVPLVLIIPYGAPMVFILTSVFACLIDLQFVIIQRYNRPRVIKLLERLSDAKSDT